MARRESPGEHLPQIGTVQNPAFFSDGDTAFLAYEIAPIDGGGHAVLQFTDVIKLVQNPQTVEGTRNSQAYPITPWGFTEVFDSEETEPWKSLSPRFWTISFNDLTIAITFRMVALVGVDTKAKTPSAALHSIVTRKL